MSFNFDNSYVAPFLRTRMNLSRYSKQLFPLVLGNSRTAFLMSNNGTRKLSRSSPLSREESEMKLKSNPYYLKYAQKIKTLKESNPVEYHKRIEELGKLYSEEPDEVDSGKVTDDKKMSAQELDSVSTNEKKKGLDAILKVELMQERSADEITQLWKEYYKDRDAVFAVIPAETYKKMHVLTQSSPLFVYPIPRKDGYEMFLGQFSGNDCNFTSLSLYQKHGENAPVQLTIHHFTEFQDSKGIVLMSGNIIDNSVNVTDAQLLSYQMQYFYCEDNYQMVKDFNLTPQTFDYNRVIQSISNSLLSKHSEIKK